MTELEAAQIRTADAQTGSLLIQEQVISTEEERGRVADDPDSPYVDLDPLKPPHALQPQPGEEGYQAQPDAWTQTFSHIADTGGLLPAPDGEPGSSNQAWSQIMGGITATGGLGHEDDGVLASPEAWKGIATGLAGSGGVAGREPLQKLLAPPLRTVFGKDAPGKATDDQYAAALGMADVANEPRKGPGAGGGEWTAGSGGGQAAGKPGAPAPKAKAPHAAHFDPKATQIDAKGVVHTTSVVDAARALYDGKKVDLKQPHEVATLVDHLGQVAKHMIAMGDAAPNFNVQRQHRGHERLLRRQ